MDAAPVPVPGPRPAALVFIFITVALDILAIGIIIPVLPHLVADFLGGDLVSAATTVGWFSTLFALMQFLFSPLLGALSDRFGRRPVILLSNLGLGLDYVFMALAQTLPLLVIGRLISGITSASISTAGAYIADVTPPEKRAAGFGLLGAAFGLGFVIGPALGGLLAGSDPRLPFWVAAALSLTNFCYGFFVLPESLPKDKRAALVLKRANPVGSLLLLKRYPQVFGLAGVVLLSNLAHIVLPATFVLYADYRFGWDAWDVGLCLAVVGVCSALVQGGLVRRVVARIGEFRALLTGLTMGAIGFAAYGYAPDGRWFFAAIPLMALWGLAGPAAQGMMTRQVDPAEQGRLQGALTSLTGLVGIFGPQVFAQTFAWFISPAAPFVLPGAAFHLAAVCLAFALLLAWRVGRVHRPTGEAPAATAPAD